MITNIFSRSNPMNFLICLVILLLAFIFSSIKMYRADFSITESIAYFSIFFVLIFTMFLTDFIAKKSNLNKNDSYAIILFTLFLLLIPETLSDFSVVVSNAFVLLALRRLVSLQSLSQSKQKILDASIWISIASIFEFWSILFFLLIFIGIILYVSNDFRNWIIPLVGLFSVFILLSLYAFIIDYGIFDYIFDKAVVKLDFSDISAIFQSFYVVVFLVIFITFLVSQLINFRNYLASLQNTIKIMVGLLLLALFVYLISENKHSLLLYCIGPLSIIGSNFINSLNRDWLKDALLYTVVILSCISFFLFI